MVVILFVAGYGDTHVNIPSNLKNGLLLLIGHLYVNRQSVVVGQGMATEAPMASREIFERFAVGDDFHVYDPGPHRHAIY